MVVRERQTGALDGSIVHPIPHPDMQRYVTEYREARAGIKPEWTAVPISYIKDRYLGNPAIAETFDISEGMPAHTFFQELIDRKVLPPAEKKVVHEEVVGETTMVYIDPSRMEAYAALRFTYRRRVFTSGPKRALNWERIVVDTKGSLGENHPLAELIHFPQEPELPKEPPLTERRVLVVVQANGASKEPGASLPNADVVFKANGGTKPSGEKTAVPDSDSRKVLKTSDKRPINGLSQHVNGASSSVVKVVPPQIPVSVPESPTKENGHARQNGKTAQKEQERLARLGKPPKISNGDLKEAERRGLAELDGTIAQFSKLDPDAIVEYAMVPSGKIIGYIGAVGSNRRGEYDPEARETTVGQLLRDARVFRSFVEQSGKGATEGSVFQYAKDVMLG